MPLQIDSIMISVNRFDVELGRLMKNRLSGILLSERFNREHVRLYRADNYWVAFERSAFHLCHIYAKSITNAMKVFRAPLPIVVTSVEDREVPFTVGDTECMRRAFVERIYRTGKPVDGKLFNEWYYQNTIVFRDTSYRRS